MVRPQYASLVLSTLLMLVALAGLGFTLAYLRGSFEEKITMYFETDNAAGLYEGMKIKYRGFDVGSLKSLELADSGVVSGELLFKQSEARFLRVGAFLKVSKEKIVTNELLLDGVDITKNLATPNTKIQLIRSDVTDDLTKRLDPMLDRFALLLDQLSDPQKGLQPTLVAANLAMRETSETLKATRSTLQDLSQSTNQLPSAITETKLMIQKLAPLAEQTGVTLKALEGTINETKFVMQKLAPVTEQTGITLKALEGTIKETTQAMGTTNTFIKNLDNPKDGIRATLRETRQTLEKTRSVLDGVDSTITDFREAPVIRWIMPDRTKNGITPSDAARTKPAN